MSKIKKEYKIIFYTSLGIILLFFLWWLIAALINSTLFPTPIIVIPILFNYLGQGSTYLAIFGTFLRLLISFVISFILGCALGLIASKFYRIECILKPFVLFFRTLPTAAIVLILIVLVKPMWTPIIVTCLVLFPLFYQSTLDGIKNISSNLKDELKMDGADQFNSTFKIYIPSISSYLLLAIIQSLGLGMKVSIMAEILGGSNQITGLGRLIHNEYIYAQSGNVIALSLIAILIIGLIDIILIICKKRVKQNDGKNKSIK